MNAFLRFLFGLEDTEAPAGSDGYWELSGLPEGGLLFFAIFLAIASMALVVLLYFNEKSLGTFRKCALAGLRLGALAIIILILLNPRLLTEITIERPGKTLVLFDTSASMEQKDNYEEIDQALVERATDLSLATQPTRTELAAAAIQKAELIKLLEEKNPVELFGFSATASPVERVDTAEYVKPTGEETRIGDVVEQVVREAGARPIAGIVLISDGRSTGGLAHRDAARQVASLHQTPIHSVAVGRRQLPKNYAVQDLSAPESVEIGFPIQIEGKVVLSGLRGPVEVILTRAERGGRAVTVDRRMVEHKNAYDEARLRFIDTLPRKGVFRYTLEVPKKPQEIDKEDNKRQAFVRAAEQEYRVLLVGGSPSPEYRFLRNFSIRDESIQVSTWQATADKSAIHDGDIVIRALPKSAKELKPYDVIVLMDPDPSVLSKAFLEAVEEFVTEDGGGLIYVAGEVNTPTIARGNAYASLRVLIAAELDGTRLNDSQVYSAEWRPLLAPKGIDHPICRLVDDVDENRDVWEALPTFYFAYPAKKLRPAAVPLAMSPEDGELVLAIQRVGLGESVYVGSDEFWRWRGGGIEYHERFWSGTLRYLAISKKLAGRRELTVETDRDVYRETDTVRVSVHLTSGGAGGPRSKVDARVHRIGDAKDEESWSVSLLPETSVAGRYTGTFRPPASGHYRVVVEPRGEARFQVYGTSAEWADLSPDMLALEDIANETGGLFVGLDQLDLVAETIPETKFTEVIGRSASTIWDSAALMTLFCVLLALEWTLRKLWRLN